MSIPDYSSVSSDKEYEHSSDSGYSVESLPFSTEEPLFTQFVNVSVYLPLLNVELLPVHLVTHEYLTNDVQGDTIQHTPFPSNRRLIKWSLPPPSVALVPLPGWKPMPYGLESFWQSAFRWFFQPFLASHGHLWTLEPTELPPLSIEWPWHSVTYFAKVRFQCQCKRGWTSMKGRVVFWFRVRRQGEHIVSEALFKLFGQQCSFCSNSDSIYEFEFLTPLWYPEEIENAISFLASQVIVSYYGGADLPKLSPSDRFFRNSGTPSSIPHDSTRCQACQYGYCTTTKCFA
ncbi:hypothetical protein OUZ56_013124 [Daphnia magna]|uniref:3CxxC-type domain-containing protein n=1 Tax=Daphnia magna TaxID=35525 RepID=A0ABQ9Z4Y8_9CRUS|nr:hypothetical protein OUZ56_013124 [Daphnia magna]